LGLKSALSVLSKSSPYSVSTLRKEGDSDAQQKLKDYLYITPPIQIEFETALKAAGVDDIICLCGSSGDGKSEILTQLYKEHSCKVDFHLDATHSKSQHQSAVDCLNDEFDKFKSSPKPLAIGINIGMLQKFMKLGDERHNNIKASFGEYFENRHTKGFKSGNVSFYDFECYPRLEYTNNKITSMFVSKFLQKLTCNSDKNPFWQYYLDDVQSSSGIINKNFEILSLEAFQNKLIELLGLARLHEEQFLTPRNFVDFVYQLLTREHSEGIVGNLFGDFDSEYCQVFKKFDPNKFRSLVLDTFYLEYSTNTLGQDLQKELQILSSWTGVELSPQGIVRCAYMLGETGKIPLIENLTKNSCLQQALKYYLCLIDIYSKDKLTCEDEDNYFNFVEDLLIISSFEYANRALPIKSNDYIVSRRIESYSICNKVSAQVDMDEVVKHKLISSDSLPIPLIINNKDTFTFDLDLKTIVQAIQISYGYRPNRQNLEAIAKFDELVSHIVSRTVDAESMKVISSDKVSVININRKRFSVEVSV